VSARYTYGDDEVAAERLALVAEVFAPTTTSFLRDVVTEPPALALDLGCGPGLTTRLLRQVTDAVRTVGVDRSSAFLERAMLDAPEGVGFVEHDVTSVPMPEGPADLIFARLLVAHLPEPPEIVRRWSTWLTIGGVLLLDELEAIHAPDAATRAYLDEVAIPVVREQGATLLAGPLLHAMSDPPGTVRAHDAVATLTPSANASARIFAMNLAVLTARGEVEPRLDLAQELEAAASGRRPIEATIWRMRQIAWRRIGE